MKSEKILEAVEIYRKLLESMGIEKIDYPHNKLLKNKIVGLSHCHGMLDKIIGFVAEGRIGKAERWLCFIQGCLWFSRKYTIGDFENHNRPDR